jgi:OMF family outer membrane factor
VSRHHLLLAALLVMPALPSPAVRAQSKADAFAGPAPITAPANQEPAAASAPSTGPAARGPAPAAASDAIPLAPQIKGSRPKSNPTVLPPAATRPPEGYADLIAPNPLSLPVKDNQVRIDQLRPLSLVEVETLAEVNNPTLKALASQVDQAQSELRSKIALWYPQLSVNANSLPTFDGGQQFRSGQANNFGGLDTPRPASGGCRPFWRPAGP